MKTIAIVSSSILMTRKNGLYTNGSNQVLLMQGAESEDDYSGLINILHKVDSVVMDVDINSTPRILKILSGNGLTPKQAKFLLSSQGQFLQPKKEMLMKLGFGTSQVVVKIYLNDCCYAMNSLFHNFLVTGNVTV